ncbi:MAG: glycosyltransferase family 9 protein [Ignavibacteriae bacterium]|nr:glycosyltransferase family 9 protein [Ignavibacteriota bacterium]
MQKTIKILIVRQESNMVGDTVCLIPAVKALKLKFPESYITMVYGWSHYNVSYKKIIPELDEVIYYDNSSLKSKIKFFKMLRRAKYDIGIVPSTIKISSNSHLINFFSGAKKRAGVRSVDGKTNKLRFLLNIKSDFDWKKQKTHQMERGLEVVRQIGCDLSKEEIIKTRFKLSDSALSFAEKYIINQFPDKEKLIIGFHPGAGQKVNTWHYNNFADLIELIDSKYKPYILITSGEIDKEITNRLSDILKEKKINFIICDKKDEEFVAVLSRISLYITNNTGVMHLASISGTKVLSFFIPSMCYQWPPITEGCEYIVSPTDNINDIEVNNVFEKVISMTGGNTR